MASRGRPPLRRTDVENIDEDTMAAARKHAQAKRARMLAEQELGIADESMPVIKGPMPDPTERQCQITLDLAPHSDRLFIDGVWYIHGRTYTVGERLYQSMIEMQANGWRHQEEIDGKDRNFYRKSKTVHLGPQGVRAA